MNNALSKDEYGYDEHFNPEGERDPADEWTAISDQLDYWADLDKMYWQQRRANEYRLFLERKYGVIAQ